MFAPRRRPVCSRVSDSAGLASYATRSSVSQKPLICRRHARAKIDPRRPTEGADLIDADQLAWRSVRLRVVVDDRPVEADDVADKPRQLQDRQIVFGPDIDVA